MQPEPAVRYGVPSLPHRPEKVLLGFCSLDSTQLNVAKSLYTRPHSRPCVVSGVGVLSPVESGWGRVGLAAAFGVLEAVAFALGFMDVTAVREPIEI